MEIKDVTELLQAGIKFERVLGPAWTGVIICLAIVVVVLPHVLGHFRDKRQEDTQRRALDDKENQIQRLADQDREWRRLFFRSHAGLTAAEVDALMERNPPAVPIDSINRKPKPAKKKGGRS